MLRDSSESQWEVLAKDGENTEQERSFPQVVALPKLQNSSKVRTTADPKEHEDPSNIYLKTSG